MLRVQQQSHPAKFSQFSQKRKKGTVQVGMSLIIWIAAALVSMLGSFCYVELGTSIRMSGGDFAYMCFMEWYPVAFAFMCIGCTINYPATLAIQAQTFAEYVFTVSRFPLQTPAFPGIQCRNGQYQRVLGQEIARLLAYLDPNVHEFLFAEDVRLSVSNSRLLGQDCRYWAGYRHWFLLPGHKRYATGRELGCLCIRAVRRAETHFSLVFASFETLSMIVHKNKKLVSNGGIELEEKKVFRISSPTFYHYAITPCIYVRGG